MIAAEICRRRAEIHADGREILLGAGQREIGAARLGDAENGRRVAEIWIEVRLPDRPGPVRREIRTGEIAGVERAAPAAPIMGGAAERADSRLVQGQILQIAEPSAIQ